MVCVGTEEGESTATIIEASKIRRREAKEEEVEQGKAKGESQQHGSL
jgi:hypothetical protein